MNILKQKNIKPPFQAGIIDVGAHSVRLELFQVDKKGKTETLESLSQPINLGYDVFRKGSISPKNINLLCAILKEFSDKLNEYGIELYRAVATSAIREAFNREILLNYIKIKTGLEVEVLEVQEEARLLFVLMRELINEEINFKALNAFTFVVGTGSLIMMYSENGKLRFGESAALGTVRLFDEFGRYELNPEKIIDLIESFDPRQTVGKTAAQANKAFTLIGLGAGVRALINIRRKIENKTIVEIDKAEMHSIIEEVRDLSPEQLVEKYCIPDNVAMSIVPCAYILGYFVEQMDCEKLIFPVITTRDALIADVTRQGPDPFINDIISISEYVGNKYCYDEKHAHNVAKNSLKIFDRLKKQYGLTSRSRILLEVAALLHDIGRFVDTRKHHKHSYYLISNAQLPGISEQELQIIAAIARYHRKASPRTSHPEYMSLTPEDKVKVCKLAAILRVGDALDRAHAEKFKNMSISLIEERMIIKIPSFADLSLERLYLKKKADLLRDVFGIKVRIEEELERL
jgi:exopolyphosphatase/guanosine-5'-triphosphate,3'-diphosphate pyrophosphatase